MNQHARSLQKRDRRAVRLHGKWIGLRAVWLLIVAFCAFAASANAGSFSNTGTLAAKRFQHTATLLPSGKVLVAGGYGLGTLSSAELYDPATGKWSAAHAMATNRQFHTATLLRSGKVLLVGGYLDQSSSILVRASAELYDPATDSWTAAGTMASARYGHTATLLESGEVLVVGGSNGAASVVGAELYNPATNSWSAAGSLGTGRRLHTATLLPSGKVLIAGGYDTGYLASVELYDPAAKAFSPAAAMASARELPTTTLLVSGKVLVAGGDDGSFLLTAELYDPSANAWTAAAPMATSRNGHTANLLPSGMVLITGGYNNTYQAGAEVYDPVVNAWSSAGSLGTARQLHTATLLPNGRVLIAAGTGSVTSLASAELYDVGATGSWAHAALPAAPAADVGQSTTLLPSGEVLEAGGEGYSPTSAILSSAQRYDPATNTWSAAAPMATARAAHTATLLRSGEVLVAGGYYDLQTHTLASAERYDPTGNIWSAAGAMAAQRVGHSMTLLASGKVLVAGGSTDSTNFLDSAEIYDPTTNAWSPAGSMTTTRSGHTATLLASGKVLVTGGQVSNLDTNIALTADLYDPSTNTWSKAASMDRVRTGHTASLLPSGKVLVAGGYGGTYMSTPTIYSSTQLYDPATDTWSAAAPMSDARMGHRMTVLPSGKVLVCGGRAFAPIGDIYLSVDTAESYDAYADTWSSAGSFLSAGAGFALAGVTLLRTGSVFTSADVDAEIYDPALAPDAKLQPGLDLAYLSSSNALIAASTGSAVDAGGAVTATGFLPLREGAGGVSNNSATNFPVIQAQRIDNGQMRFIPNNENVSTTDTAFTANAGAFTGFPTGPMLVRAWVNGIPGPAAFVSLETDASDVIFRDGFNPQFP